MQEHPPPPDPESTIFLLHPDRPVFIQIGTLFEIKPQNSFQWDKEFYVGEKEGVSTRIEMFHMECAFPPIGYKRAIGTKQTETSGTE